MRTLLASHLSSMILFRIAAVSLLLALSLQSAELAVTERSLVFEHTASFRKDPANVTGFNHAPTIAALPDGRLMTAWFAAPFEGAVSQRIMHAFSADQGRSW